MSSTRITSIEPFPGGYAPCASARIADPAWIREWVALYERGEQGLTRLDTRRMDLGPAAMIA